MGAMVNCVKMKRELEGLDKPPYPGDLGQRVFENVSKEGWAEWLKHQTMLLNEYRLSPIDPKARKFLEEQMDKFFFGDGGETPPEFKPE
ncbi:MAG: oxidative damage protection protein [Sedimenticolaceae bacterium]|jgi:Fe-S cluster biosynthesis and repair protein YggX